MFHYKSNQPLYQLHFSELEENAVKVLSFEGEESISRLFEYRFELVSEDPELDAKSILNKKATFTLTRGEDEPLKIHGIISRFEQRGRTPDYVSYYAVLAPKLWRLGLIFQNEVYQKMDLAKLIAKVMETSGFSGEDYEINLSASYPEQEYVVQYQETNFNFLNRRLEHLGIFYYFDHREDNEVIVFTDANENLRALEPVENVSYKPNKDPLNENETISELACEEKIVTGMVRLKDYNYLHPEKQLQVESQIDADSPGMYYAFGDHFEDESQGELLARVRNEEFLSESKVYKGRSDCRLFHAGFRFKLTEHYREEWNEEYVLTKLFARGTQRGLFGILQRAKEVVPTFENIFEAIPVAIAYRPPRRTPVPRISGIMSAKVESGSGDEYAFIDDLGRYRAKMLFDLTETSNGEATLPIRQVQAYSGSGYGMHFPNHADTEMVWACVDGNVDRPIGLGTVPNPSQASPVTGANKTINAIKTASNNVIEMDDTKGTEKMTLSTPWDNVISAGNDQNISVGNNRSVSIASDDSQSVGGKRDIKVTGNKSETIEGTNTLSVTGDDTETFKAKRSVAVTADDTENYNAKRTLTVTADDTETYNAKRALTVAADDTENYNAKRTVTVAADDTETYSAKRTVNVTGADQETYSATRKVGVTGNDELTVGGTLTITSTGKLSATGDGNVEIKGPQIKITGDAEITIAVGGSSIKITPAGIEISGPKITSAASGPNEITGAMVKLN